MHRIWAAVSLAIALVLGGCRPDNGRSQVGDHLPGTAVGEIGLLVGLSSGRTLWISSENGAVRLLADRPHLLVPRPDGFWWVGTVRRCSIDERDGDGMEVVAPDAFVNSSQEIFATRVSESARVTLDGIDCASAERQVTKLTIAHQQAQADSLAASGDSSFLRSLRNDTTWKNIDPTGLYCSVVTREITFVSASLLSVEHRNQVTEFCSPAKYYTSGENHVTRFDAREPIPLRSVLTQRQKERLAEHLAAMENCNLDNDSTDATKPGWAVRRDSGAWVASVFIDGPIVCRGGTEIEYRPTLPPSFTWDAPLPIAWVKLKSALPGLRDAAASPSGVFLALLVGDTLSLAGVREGTLGDVRIKVPVGPSEEFVMLRWATASELSEWNRVIPRLPEPRIQIHTTR